MSTIWSVAIVEGETGKDIYVGREDGTLQRFKTKTLAQALPRLENGNHNASTAVAQLTVQAHSKPITAIIATTADEVTTCSTDGSLRTFNTASEVEGKRELRRVELGSPLRALLISGEQTFVGGQDGTIFVIGGGETQKWKGHTDVVAALAAGETSMVSGSYDQTVRVWDPTTGKTLFVLVGHQNQVRSVAQLGGYIFSAARDDTLRIYALPDVSASGGGDANPPAGDGDPSPDTAASKLRVADATPLVRPVAVIELPATPTASVVSGSNVCMGFSDGKLRVISTKDLIRTMDEFKRRNATTHATCKKHLDANAAVSIKNLKLKNKKAISQKKKALRAAAQEAASASAAARRAAKNPDDEEEPEPQDDGEDGGADVPLGEEREAELNNFVEAEKLRLAEAIAQVQAAKDAKIAELDPIVKQAFLTEREKFDRVTFTRSYDTLRPESVLAVAVDATTSTAYAGSAMDLLAVSCKPGVLAL